MRILDKIIKNFKYGNKLKKPLILAVALVILIGAASVGTYSMYAKGVNGSSSARVAKFDVKVTPSAPALSEWSNGANFTDDAFFANINGGNSKEYTYTLTNNSEVRVRAKVVIDAENADSNLKPTITISGGSNINNTNKTVDLEMSGTSAKAEVKVKVPAVSNSATNDGTKIHFEYEQID